MADNRSSITIEFDPAELDLIRNALRVLLSTLGHDEADELVEVKALLERLSHAA